MSEPLTGKGIDPRRSAAQGHREGRLCRRGAGRERRLRGHRRPAPSPAGAHRGDRHARRAKRSPACSRVLTHRNAPEAPRQLDEDRPRRPRPPAPPGSTRFSTAISPIALVVADTLERAQHAASTDPGALRAGAASASTSRRSSARAYTPAARRPGRRARLEARQRRRRRASRRPQRDVADATYTTPVENHNPMEPHATIAVWQGDDRLTLYDATQGIFGVRERIAAVFGSPQGERPRHLSLRRRRLRLQRARRGRTSRSRRWPRRCSGAAVKLVVTRPQMFSLVGHRPQHRAEGRRSGADATREARGDQARGLRRDVELRRVRRAVARCRRGCSTPAPTSSTSHRLVRLDVGTPTFMRAPGESTGTFALESAMDELAVRAASIDPLELRLANYAETDPGGGQAVVEQVAARVLPHGAERFGWTRREPAPRVDARRAPARRLGHGDRDLSRAAKRVRRRSRELRADGTALVQAGSQDIGTGTYTDHDADRGRRARRAAGARALRARRHDVPRDAGVGRLADGVEHGSAVKLAGVELRAKLVAAAVADAGVAARTASPAARRRRRRGALCSKAESSKRDPYGAIVPRSGEPEITAEVHNEAEGGPRQQLRDALVRRAVREVRVDETLGRDSRRADRRRPSPPGRSSTRRRRAASSIGGMMWGIGHRAPREHGARSARRPASSRATSPTTTCPSTPTFRRHRRSSWSPRTIRT